MFGEWSRPTGNNSNTDSDKDKSSNTYLKWNGTDALVATEIPSDAKVISASETTWNGTYVVKEDITINDDVTIAGDVDLIILDGKTLKINGKHLHESSFTYKLSIYAQSEGDDKGKLVINTTADNDDGYAIVAKDIDIHGGDINISATGSDTQGIYSSNLFNIYGGKVTVYGTMEGIMLANSLTIYDGTVIANAGATSAGQGGIAIAGTLVMNGGKVTATGGDGVEKDGGKGFDGTLTVNGGTIILIGGNGTIGSLTKGAGGHGFTGTLTVIGGKLIATGGNGGDGNDTYNTGANGGYGIYYDSAIDIDISGGIVTATGGNGGNGNTSAGLEGNGGNGGYGIRLEGDPSNIIIGASATLTAKGGNGGNVKSGSGKSVGVQGYGSYVNGTITGTINSTDGAAGTASL